MAKSKFSRYGQDDDILKAAMQVNAEAKKLLKDLGEDDALTGTNKRDIKKFYDKAGKAFAKKGKKRGQGREMGGRMKTRKEIMNFLNPESEKERKKRRGY